MSEREKHCMELVAFRVAGQDFGIDIMTVREIRGWTIATALPQSPDFVRGVVNLRGTVLPVIDLSQRLGLGAIEPTARSAVIVTQIGSRVVGLLVDAVSEIVDTAGAVIQPAPDIGGDEANRLLRGILTMDDRMVSIISLDEIMPDLPVDEAA
jgi:purine-binding chemotaxis protein CheW